MTHLIVDFVDWIGSFLVSTFFDQLRLPFEFFSNLESYLYVIMDFLNKIAFLVPIADIFICLGIIIAMRIAMFSLFAFNWVIRRIVDAIP